MANKKADRNARKALSEFKYEISNELGLKNTRDPNTNDPNANIVDNIDNTGYVNMKTLMKPAKKKKK